MRAALLTLLLFLAQSAAMRGAAAAQLNYTLYVLGIPVADAVVALDFASGGYRASLRYHTTGVATVIGPNRLDSHAKGIVEADRPVALEYGSNGRIGGQDRVANIVWRDGMPTVTALAPPNETERDDVPAALRARTIDPLSAIVLLVRQTARTGRCDAVARTFDGRRAQLFETRSAGEEELPGSRHTTFAGRALRCEFTDQTLGGFRLGAGREDDLRVHRGTIWLSQVFPDSPILPTRAAVETRILGDAMIYLTSASP